MANHKCRLEDCDGTKLGHELARTEGEPAHGWGCGDCTDEFSLGLDCGTCGAPMPDEDKP